MNASHIADKKSQHWTENLLIELEIYLRNMDSVFCITKARRLVAAHLFELLNANQVLNIWSPEAMIFIPQK